MTPRVTSEFWVKAYMTRLRVMDIPAFLTSRGDATAGAVLVKINTLDGNAAAYQRSYDVDGNRIWVPLSEGTDAEVEEALSRQRQYDPDIWIIEVEDKQGRSLLDQDGLSG
jgi:hypothetical protein